MRRLSSNAVTLSATNAYLAHYEHGAHLTTPDIVDALLHDHTSKPEVDPTVIDDRKTHTWRTDRELWRTMAQ